MLKQPSTGFVAGLIAGVLIITLLNVFGVDFGDEDEHIEPALTSEGAAASFVDDWSRMRKAEWAIDATFIRTLDGGQRYETQVRQAQRPPDSFREDARTADITLDGQHYVCAAAETQKYTSCRRVGVAPTFESQVASDVMSVKNDVIGENRRYDVQDRSGGCYGLYLRPTPKGTLGQWGTQGEVCFDSKTGAVSRTEVTRPGTTDTVVATQIRAQAGPDDIRIPAPIVESGTPRG